MHQTFHAQPLQAKQLFPAFQKRVLSLDRGLGSPQTHLVLLSSGQLALRSPGDEAAHIEAPALLVLPPQAGQQLVVEAGARAYLVGASFDHIVEALGEYPETSGLRSFVGHRTVLSNLSPADMGRLEQQFDGMSAEAHVETAASWMALSAHLRLIVIAAWRLGGGLATPVGGKGDGFSVLQQFRQLVEAEFRRHRPISFYAAELGVSTDRLHAAATRHLKRSPIELVHDRLAQEARLRLERSTLSVQAVSDSLNFRDPAHFSRFFKRKTGYSPAQYRATLPQAVARQSDSQAFHYHEWP